MTLRPISASAAAAVLAVCAAAIAADGGGACEQFARFCAAHFGAEKEPEVYRMFGRDLEVAPRTVWSHVSRTSACFAWETSLPARSCVEYGPTAGYGHRTPTPAGHFCLHLHHLKGLAARTTYHYRLVAVDERGNRVATKDRTFVTGGAAGAIELPGRLDGPPFVLDRPGATYLVTRDIAADGTAIFIAASGVTVDLGGHTITYDGRRDTAGAGACGVRGHKVRGSGLSKVAVVNGTVKRGRGGSTTRKVWQTLYSPIFFSRPSGLEIAGVDVDYDGGQVVAIALIIRGQACDIHHNRFVDRGTALLDRHVGIDVVTMGPGKSKCRHNLIRRTRHRGIHAQAGNEVHGNEIYVDSHATNSYGIMYYAGRGGAAGLAVHHNRVFGSGYHPVGIGSGQGYSDVKVHSNYIQMQGTSPKGRWAGGRGGGDPAGQLHPVNGIRLQAPGRNVEHYDNVIVAKGSGKGCLMRGLWLVPGARSGPGLVLRRNRVKLIAEDALAEGYAVSAGGAGQPEGSATVELTDNTVISNLCHVQFGDNYSHGGRYAFTSNRFVKVGRDGRYRTIRLGWRGWKYGTSGHVFTDTEFGGRAGFDSVSFDGSRAGRYGFSVAWTVGIKTAAGARVSITDSTGAEVFSGRAGLTGRIAARLIQYERTRAGQSPRTPHTITVRAGPGIATRKVTVDRARRIEIGI